MSSLIDEYAQSVKDLFHTGHAKEHAYRPALERLMSSFENTVAVNDPKRSEHGNPDFVFLKKSHQNIILGYAEAKDIGVSLDKTEKTNQMSRYGGYENLYLTDYLEFRFFQNGNKYQTLSIGEVKNGDLVLSPENYSQLEDELANFLELPPEQIKSGKRLSQIMGAKARRIRDNVAIYLKHEDNEQNQQLEKIYGLMKELLVHDLSPDQFADMYAQTLVYGLFVARYADPTPDSFTRSEARDLIPSSNPFLREFFDHIAGTSFDKRLGYIVDELCEVFSVSNVHDLIQKHLRLFEVDNEKDPIIHFYEDFLKEYDPDERKKMGAYYTPIPVVRFIIKQVDEVLKSEFGLVKGIADNSKKPITIKSQGTKHKVDVHRVQILDPAVGTATFLNEIIRHIHKTFGEGQAGRWASYAKQDLLPRLYGFELMMAPYTIAHLKLGMTLQDTGVKDYTQRLGVYLTNTLEEGIKHQQDLFSIGLADVVTQESHKATEIKHERPIMVVIGNPPYSVSSNNKNEYVDKLLSEYKKDLNERNIQPLSDDYIKFIRFAEDMIAKNGEGVLAMITNNSYLDGLIHRQMRKHLLLTFDKIYILDLHGSTKRQDTAEDGTKDENVFDIQQGVSIIVALKTGKKKSNQLGSVLHGEMFGLRRKKFEELDKNNVAWKEVITSSPNYFFVPKDNTFDSEYEKYISIRDLMPFGDAGIKTHRDAFVVDIDKNTLTKRVNDFYSLTEQEIKDKYKLKETSDFSITKSQQGSDFDANCLIKVNYRPFDVRWAYYSTWLMDRPRLKTTNQFINKENLGLAVCRQQSTFDFQHALITDLPIDMCTVSLQTKETGYALPLYIYHEDGTRTPNLKPDVLKALTNNISSFTPEDILDYIYAVLYAPTYRKKYKEQLKIAFPRVPVPKDEGHFTKLVGLGRNLRALHLFKSSTLDDTTSTYPIDGSDEVERLEYSNDQVWINDEQYFGNIPSSAWNFYIGGYQPAQKWLKDRRGRTLTNDEIEHYQQIIKVLIETAETMQDIDKVLQS